MAVKTATKEQKKYHITGVLPRTMIPIDVESIAYSRNQACMLAARRIHLKLVQKYRTIPILPERLLCNELMKLKITESKIVHPTPPKPLFFD